MLVRIYCIVFINLHNLPIIWSLGYFQICSVVNNAVMNNFLNKMFLCTSNYAIRIVSQCQIVKSFSILFPSPLSCYLRVVKLKLKQISIQIKTIKPTKKNPKLTPNNDRWKWHPVYLLILCSLVTLIMFSLYNFWASVFPVFEFAF